MISILAKSGIALVLSFTLLTGAAHAAPQRAAMSHLKLAITTTSGTVWGKVKVSYKAGGKTVKHTCSTASCSYAVAKGTKVSLHQTPTDSSTWPFSQWKITAGGKSTSSSKPALKVTVSGTMKVTAVYVAGGY